MAVLPFMRAISFAERTRKPSPGRLALALRAALATAVAVGAKVKVQPKSTAKLSAILRSHAGLKRQFVLLRCITHVLSRMQAIGCGARGACRRSMPG